MVCYVVLFVALNYWQVGRKEELDAEFDNTRQVLREFNKPRGPIVTADGIVAAISYPDRRRRRPLQVPARVPDRRPAVRGDRLLHVRLRRRPRSSGSTATCSPARPPSSRCAASATCSRARSTTPAPCSWPLRADAQEVAKFLLGGRTGLDRRDGAGDRCGAGDVQQPDLRPEHVRQRRVRGRPAGRSPTCRTPPANPLLSGAYQERYMPGSTFKVITTGIGLENGSLTLESTVPQRARVGAAPDERPDPELQRQHLRRRPRRSVRPQLQHPVRQDGDRHGAGGVPRRRRRRGASARRSRSTSAGPPPARSATPTTWPTSSRCSASAASGRARPRWCRCTWRWSPRPSPTAAR